MASAAFHGSAIPLPSASTPQRSQVDGMNCIQPTAPAELGPMFPPKLDSILLIAASTCQGMPYVDPARSRSRFRLESGSCCGLAGAMVKETGIEIEPGTFGAAALGSETLDVAPGPDETENPRTGGPDARAVPASRARPTAATTRRRITRLERGAGPAARSLLQLPSSLLPPASPQP